MSAATASPTSAQPSPGGLASSPLTTPAEIFTALQQELVRRPSGVISHPSDDRHTLTVLSERGHLVVIDEYSSSGPGNHLFGTAWKVTPSEVTFVVDADASRAQGADPLATLRSALNHEMRFRLPDGPSTETERAFKSMPYVERGSELRAALNTVLDKANPLCVADPSYGLLVIQRIGSGPDADIQIAAYKVGPRFSDIGSYFLVKGDQVLEYSQQRYGVVQSGEELVRARQEISKFGSFNCTARCLDPVAAARWAGLPDLKPLDQETWTQRATPATRVPTRW